MMSARTSFLVWWGLPILCAGLGALLANYANLDGGGNDGDYEGVTFLSGLRLSF